MSLTTLTPHPSSASAPRIKIDASAAILAGRTASFRYRVRGDVRRIRVPPAAASQRLDELWRHTCFEAFIGTDRSARYAELNFSPSGAWALYSFERYRARLEPAPAIDAPAIRVDVSDTQLLLTATVQFAVPEPRSALGLTAVIEDVDGQLSYWATAHAGAHPDFHDPAGWTCTFERLTDKEPW